MTGPNDGVRLLAREIEYLCALRDYLDEVDEAADEIAAKVNRQYEADMQLIEQELSDGITVPS